MSLADWAKAKKKKRLAQKRVKLERKLVSVTEEYLKLEPEASDIVPPPTRMTEEYLEFLKQKEADSDNFRNTNEEV